MFPAFNRFHVDEIHVVMASRELAELDLIATIAEEHDVAVGVIDVKLTTSRFRPTSPTASGAPWSTRRPTGCPSHRTAACPRRPGGPPAASSTRWCKGCASCGTSWVCMSEHTLMEPVQRYDALLADIERGAAQADGVLRPWWLGQAGFLVQWRGQHLLLDPYLSDSLTTSTRPPTSPTSA